MRKCCAYLTMTNPGDYVMDYELSYGAMAERGWQVRPVAWLDPKIDWDEFDAVYICTPWDYPDHPQRFLQLLETIDQSRAHLVNPLPLVHWTLQKTYLRDLEQQGASIVPSLWFDDIDVAGVEDWFTSIGSDTLVIKPVIGVSAHDTYVLNRPVDATLTAQLATTFADRPFFVQPFADNIRTEGEFSLFFFSGKYSHAILKTPKSGDFRVQEEYGADIRSVTPPSDLIAAAKDVLGLIAPEPVYVRIDYVRGNDGGFWLMELELIEPALYLRMDANAPDRFAAAFDAYVAAQGAQ